MSPFSSTPPLLTPTLSLPPHTIRRPGDPVHGTCHFDLALATDPKSGRPKVERVEAAFRVKMTTTFMKQYGQTTDYRKETTTLWSEDLVLWSSTSLATPAGSSFSSSGASGSQPLLLSFSFKVPSDHPLPPSFEGGQRSGYGGTSTEGHAVARVAYYVKIMAVKSATFSSNERHTLPFICMPHPTCSLSSIPLPLLPPPTPSGLLPSTPPSIPPAWLTYTATGSFRDSLLAKKSHVVVKLSMPGSQFGYPQGAAVPYHLTLLTLAPPHTPLPSSSSAYPPEKASSSQLPDHPPAASDLPTLPPISSLSLTLHRHLHTTARGASQSLTQLAGSPLIVPLNREQRTWFSAPAIVPFANADARRKGLGVEHRWGVEVTVVGEMRLGGAETAGVGPSFHGWATHGLLTCEYSLGLHLPLKGLLNRLNVEPFVPITISPPLPFSLDGSSASGGGEGGNVVPPSYFEVFGDEEEGEKSAGKAGWSLGKKG